MARQAQVEMDEVYQVAQAEIAENANSVEFVEADAEVVAAEPDNAMPDFMKGE